MTVSSELPNRASRDSATTATAAAPSRRETAGDRARAQTRLRLLNSGKVLFAENGLHRTTTHDIAAHAGVAAGTFYNHFADKGALFHEITAEGIRELDARLQLGAHPSRRLRDGVRRHAEALVSFAEDHRELIRILFSRESDAYAVQDGVLADLAARIAEGRRQAIAREEMPAAIDPDVLAQAVVGMWARVVAWWAEDPERTPRETVIETLTRIQLEGTHPSVELDPEQSPEN
jgi:TetR/AcrR family transcriptional repressor of mexJK operon